MLMGVIVGIWQWRIWRGENCSEGKINTVWFGIRKGKNQLFIPFGLELGWCCMGFFIFLSILFLAVVFNYDRLFLFLGVMFAFWVFRKKQCLLGIEDRFQPVNCISIDLHVNCWVNLLSCGISTKVLTWYFW